MATVPMTPIEMQAKLNELTTIVEKLVAQSDPKDHKEKENMLFDYKFTYIMQQLEEIKNLLSNDESEEEPESPKPKAKSKQKEQPKNNKKKNKKHSD